MRTYLTAVTIVALMGLSSESAWGQARSGTGTGLGSTNTSSFGTRTSTFGTPTQNTRTSSPSVGSQVQTVRDARQRTSADRGTGRSSQAFRTGADVQRGNQRARTTTSRARTTQFGRTTSGYGRTTSRYGRTQQQLRTVVRVGFEVPALPARTDVSSALVARLENSPRIRTESPVSVVMQGRTLVLRGAVASEHDRVLAGLLARLEPGVDQVENQLSVAQPADAPPEPPPSR